MTRLARSRIAPIVNGPLWPGSHSGGFSSARSGTARSWCRLVPRQDVRLIGTIERPDGAAEYLGSMDPAEAARVMGSAARRDAVLRGASVREVVDAGKPAPYRTTLVGDGAWHALVKNGPVDDLRDALLEALAPGGHHHGLLVDIRQNLGVRQLRHGIAKMTRRIEDHERWIADPSTKDGVEFHPHEDVERWVKEKWPADIRRLRVQRAIYEMVLKEKDDGR